MTRTRMFILLSALLVGAVGFTFASDARRRMSESVGELDHTPLAPIPLTGETLTSPLAFATPTEIAIVGTHIVVVDIGSDSALHAVDRRSGATVASFGRRGSGPGELEGVWSIDPDRDNVTGFWVYDLALKRSLHADLGGRERPPALEQTAISFLNAGATLFGPLKGANDEWVSLGLFADGRIGSFSPSGLPVSVLGEVPGPADAPVLTRQSVFHSTLVAHPDRRRFAALTRYASQLELFAPDEKEMRVIEGPLFVDPDAPSRSQTRFGYIDGATTGSKIFGLFSGRTRDSFPDQANFGQFVHVFDWNGEYLDAFQLDRDALAIAVSEDGDTLYTLVHDPEPAVIEYLIGIPDGKALASSATAQQTLDR